MAPVSTSAMSKRHRVALPLAMSPCRVDSSPTGLPEDESAPEPAAGSPSRAGGSPSRRRAARPAPRHHRRHREADRHAARDGDDEARRPILLREDADEGGRGRRRPRRRPEERRRSRHQGRRPASYEPPAAAATVDQSACMYRPRVQGIVARPAGPDQEQRPDAAQRPRLQGRLDAVQPGGDPGPAADDPSSSPTPTRS